MRRTIAIGLGVGVLAVMLPTCTPSTTYTGTDKIDFSNRPSLIVGPMALAPGAGSVGPSGLRAEAGVLVDGRPGPRGSHVNDAGFVSNDDRLEIPNRIPRSFGDYFYPDRRQEIIAFTNSRRPAFVSVAWQWGEDIDAIAFKEPIGIPVTIWIVTGPPATPQSSSFDQQRIRALEAVVRTASIWRQERGGFSFTDIRIVDAINDPQAANRAAVPGNPTESNTWKPLRDEIGFDSGRLNIYWVDTVGGNMGSGFSNFGPQIAMGQQTGDELLVHEIGHALSLRHPNTTAQGDLNPPEVLAQFDDTNIMHNGSTMRAFITEGQTVRMHWNHESIVWTLMPDVGQFSPRPDCDHLGQSGACPVIYRRIWADGTFPANN